VAKVAIDGVFQEVRPDEYLIDLINRAGGSIPHVCYHPQLGPVQTCDTCMVEVDGRLVRACATEVSEGTRISTKSAKAAAAQVEAFDRILSNHMLYCTVCDNNNGNCTVHNMTKMLAIEHQKIPFRPKPYQIDNTNPFYRYDPDQCIPCGRGVEACQNVEVNETLSINWEDPNPRVLWDGGSTIGESSCVSCGYCVTVRPCNALMEKTMLRYAAFLTALRESALSGMIDVVKGVEPETGFGPFFRSRRRKRRCRSTASGRRKQFAPTAVWVAASTSGQKIVTFSKLRRSTVRPTEFPLA
jgi:formate dehydrogenase major subunit